MANYAPAPFDGEAKELVGYVQRELRRIASAYNDGADRVFYRTSAQRIGSLSTGMSANLKLVGGNVFLLSTSVTLTLTGLARLANFADRGQERVYINVGTGVLTLKNQAAESSASNRFAMAADLNLSAGAAATLWRDSVGGRWRCLSHT